MTARPVCGKENRPAPAKAAATWGFILVGCWMLLGILGWLDYITGYELSFFVFYSVPVGVAAWYVGRWPAVGLAVGATMAWLLADYFGGEKYSARFYYYWNSTIHFLAFLINAVSIAKIKSDLDRRHVLAAELESAQETLRAVLALWPGCPGCGKLRHGADKDGAAQALTLARTHPEAVGILCADCRNSDAHRFEAAPHSAISHANCSQPSAE